MRAHWGVLQAERQSSGRPAADGRARRVPPRRRQRALPRSVPAPHACSRRGRRRPPRARRRHQRAPSGGSLGLGACKPPEYEPRHHYRHDPTPKSAFRCSRTQATVSSRPRRRTRASSRGPLPRRRSSRCGTRSQVPAQPASSQCPPSRAYSLPPRRASDGPPDGSGSGTIAAEAIPRCRSGPDSPPGGPVVHCLRGSRGGRAWRSGRGGPRHQHRVASAPARPRRPGRAGQTTTPRTWATPP
jgi:hypothetical protein